MKTNEDHYEPWGVASDPDGLLVATDHRNHQIQVFDANGRMLYQFGTRGKGDGEIWYPAGVFVDPSGNIYVADHGNHRIQVNNLLILPTCVHISFLPITYLPTGYNNNNNNNNNINNIYCVRTYVLLLTYFLTY